MVDKNCPHPHFLALGELTPALIPWFKKKVKALETFLLLCFHKIQYKNFTKKLKTSWGQVIYCKVPITLYRASHIF